MIYEVWSVNGLETRRTEHSVAKDDVSIFWWLGRKAWIKEVPA